MHEPKAGPQRGSGRGIPNFQGSHSPKPRNPRAGSRGIPNGASLGKAGCQRLWGWVCWKRGTPRARAGHFGRWGLHELHEGTAFPRGFLNNWTNGVLLVPAPWIPTPPRLEPPLLQPLPLPHLPHFGATLCQALGAGTRLCCCLRDTALEPQASPQRLQHPVL